MKYLLILTMLTFLAACGSGDNSNYVEDLGGLSGPASEPSLTDVNVVNGQSIPLNSKATGVIKDNEPNSLMFTSNESGLVLFILKSDAEDVDLNIGGSDETFYSSSSSTSHEVIAININADVTYSIFIESYFGSGDYSLIVVEANRTSLQLTEGEFFVVSQDSGSDICDNEPDFTFNNDSYYIINPYQGYIKSPSSEPVKLIYEGNNKFSYSISSSDDEYSAEYTGMLTLNSTTGSVAGYYNGTSIESYNGMVTECTLEMTLDGKIIL